VLATEAGDILLVALVHHARFARLLRLRRDRFTHLRVPVILPPSLGGNWQRRSGACAGVHQPPGSRRALGGFYHYANLLLHTTHQAVVASAVFLALLVTAISIAIAWRDREISARVWMLWIEAVSVTFDFDGWSCFDADTARSTTWIGNAVAIAGQVSGGGLTPWMVGCWRFQLRGIMKAATTLGAEGAQPAERNHFRATGHIRARSLAGAIFIFALTRKCLGLRTVGKDLGASQAPNGVVLAGVGAV